MRFYNATYENKEWMCDNYAFNFRLRNELRIPDRYGHIAIDDLKYDGVFCVDDIRSIEEFRVAEREALINYLQHNVRRRIHNFDAHYEDLRRAGVHFEKSDPLYVRLTRWEKELGQALNDQAPVEMELSYLSKDKREALGINASNIINLEDAKEVEELKKRGLHTNIFEGFDAGKVIDFKPAQEFQIPTGPDSFQTMNFEKAIPKKTKAVV